MTVTPILLSVNVGLPKSVAWQGKSVYTGAWKHPVDGPAMARRLNIDGDGQGDTNGHGGEQRAVLVYQIPLEPLADGEVLICCARPRGDIVLDM